MITTAGGAASLLAAAGIGISTAAAGLAIDTTTAAPANAMPYHADIAAVCCEHPISDVAYWGSVQEADHNPYVNFKTTCGGGPLTPSGIPVVCQDSRVTIGHLPPERREPPPTLATPLPPQPPPVEFNPYDRPELVPGFMPRPDPSTLFGPQR